MGLQSVILSTVNAVVREQLNETLRVDKETYYALV